jgi:hypothetical protein
VVCEVDNKVYTHTQLRLFVLLMPLDGRRSDCKTRCGQKSHAATKNAQKVEEPEIKPQKYVLEMQVVPRSG